MLTDVGTKWFESEYPKYKERLLKKFPHAPDTEVPNEGVLHRDRSSLLNAGGRAWRMVGV